WFAQLFLTLFMQHMQRCLQLNKAMLTDEKLMPVAMGQEVGDMLSTLLPFLLLLFIAILITCALPGGFIYSAKLFSPRFQQLNPLKGLARMFSLNALVELGKSILKISLLALCLYLFLSQLWQRLLMLQRLDLNAALQEGMGLLALCLMLTACALLLIAAIDVPYQAHKIAKELKMTKQEVKEERKSADGSPEEHTSELQSRENLVCRLLLEKKKK